MSLTQLFEPVIGHFVRNPSQIGIALTLIASALYWRKATAAASSGQAVVAKVVFAAVIIGVLLLSGIIPRLNTDLAMQYATDAYQFGVELAGRGMAELQG